VIGNVSSIGAWRGVAGIALRNGQYQVLAKPLPMSSPTSTSRSAPSRRGTFNQTSSIRVIDSQRRHTSPPMTGRHLERLPQAWKRTTIISQATSRKVRRPWWMSSLPVESQPARRYLYGLHWVLMRTGSSQESAKTPPCLAGTVKLIIMESGYISNNLHASLPQAGSVRSISLIDSLLFCRK
jgi:hypothetical protein